LAPGESFGSPIWDIQPNSKGFIVEEELSPQYPVSLVEQITDYLTNTITEAKTMGG
jgi:hypothetical protein